MLLLADTHLGFDLPFRPRIQRRRRGHDFFRNFEIALEAAIQGEVDCVVHGGDLLFRSKVRLELVQTALEPLLAVADKGVPVLLVPGNHERSQIPFGLLTRHPNLFIFNRPRTYELKIGGIRLAFSGFPFFRGDVRGDFNRLLEETGWRQVEADARLLCLHQCIEGAQVGPVNFTFRNSRDVIRACDLPAGFLAVLSGHIHRAQVLTCDLEGNPLNAPVLYPGSVERTSFAEKDEAKGYMLLEVEPSQGSRPDFRWAFRELPARPMVQVKVDLGSIEDGQLAGRIKSILSGIDPDAVVQLRLEGQEARSIPVLKANVLRSLAPPTMNLSLVWRNEKDQKPN